MSVEVVTAIVGAAFLLALLLKVLRDKCVKKDHEESEYYEMVGSCSTDFDGMCFFPLFVSLSFSGCETRPAAVSLAAPSPPLISSYPRSSLSLSH